ncbi:MAG TPA: DNA gyrase inhibitor YacG [Polyangia bacterium]|nr:DNA gyrase inhibitor YacG [Polyangia bacterium]
MSAPKPHPCPICKSPVAADAPAFPFCSPRCRLIDLGNWLDGKYAIPADNQDDGDGGDDEKR